MGAALTAIAHDGEPLDALLWRTIGRTRGAVETVIAANPGLGSHVLSLPGGMEIRIPLDAGDQVRSPLINLWDAPTAAPAAAEAPIVPSAPPEDYVPDFNFIATDPVLVWTIDHNLGHRPVISVRDATGAEIGADITNPTLNQTVVTFTEPTAGSARLV